MALLICAKHIENTAAWIRLPCCEPAMLGGTPADPALECRGEGKGILVADGAGDGFDLLVGGGQQLGSSAHAQIDDLMHGAAPHLLPRQPSEMLRAEMGV